MTEEKSMLTKWVKIQFIKEGIHRYPAAATESNLNSVEYLGYPHHHYFYFYVTIQVFHNDRDIEFQMFRRWCESQFKDDIIKIDYKSCEMLAEELINLIKVAYPGRDMQVEVYEDDINGSVVQYTRFPEHKFDINKSQYYILPC